MAASNLLDDLVCTAFMIKSHELSRCFDMYVLAKEIYSQVAMHLARCT